VERSSPGRHAFAEYNTTDRPKPRIERIAPSDTVSVVAESLLDRLIDTSHQVFMNGPSYGPVKRPKAAVLTA
jgi:hypothetical protein